jgi:ribokinase
MWDLCCIGDINFDVIVYPFRHTPEEDEQIVDSIFLERGGSATNCACVASSLGLGTVLLCKLPSDELGQWLRNRVETHGVDVRSPKSERNAGITVALTEKSGKRSFVTYRGTNTDFTMDNIDFGAIKSSRHLHYAGFWIVERLHGEPSKKILGYAKEHKLSTSLDLGWDFYGWSKKRRKLVYDLLPHVDTIFLNKAEIRSLTATRNTRLAVNSLFKAGVSRIMLHLGKQGSKIYEKKQSVDIPSIPCEPRNTTGAGDAYAAAFIYGMLKGHNIRRAATLASACASLYISHDPGYVPTLVEVNKMVKTYGLEGT